MKIEFIANASFLIELADGKKLLTDPWLVEGAFYGSWFNFPPVQNKKKYLECLPDYIYVSHIHPDHFSSETLKKFSKETEIWIGQLPHKHLENQIRGLGFNNIRVFPLEATTQLGQLEITFFGDFAGSSLGYDNDLEYAMDTSFLLKDSDDQTLFNINDNTIQEKNAREIYEKFGSPDISIIPCSGASSFPHAFDIYDDAKKESLCTALTDKMCLRFTKISQILKSKWSIPAAGSYVMAGSIAHYSKYLHQPTPDYLNQFCAEQGMDVGSLLHMYEGDVFESKTGILKLNTEAGFRGFTRANRTDYALSLTAHKLAHEEIVLSPQLPLNWPVLLKRARQTMWSHQERLGLFPEWNIELISLNGSFSYKFSLIDIENKKFAPSTLSYKIDERLMLMALNRAANWNNIEIGALVKISRTPDEFVPSLPNLMCYFQL